MDAQLMVKGYIDGLLCGCVYGVTVILYGVTVILCDVTVMVCGMAVMRVVHEVYQSIDTIAHGWWRNGCAARFKPIRGKGVTAFAYLGCEPLPLQCCKGSPDLVRSEAGVNDEFFNQTATVIAQRS